MVKTLIESCKGFDGTVKQPPVQWRNHCSVVDMCMQQVLNNRWTGENTSWQLPFCMKPFHWWVHCIPRQPLPFKNTSDCQKLLSELKTVPICSRTSLSCTRNLKKSVMTWMLVKFFFAATQSSHPSPCYLANLQSEGKQTTIFCLVSLGQVRTIWTRTVEPAFQLQQ